MKKRIFTALLILLLCLALPTLAVKAYATEVVASGTCGDDLIWALDDAGTLTISGSGAMWDYSISPSIAPWYDYSYEIKTLIIEDGVTHIGVSAFGCINISSRPYGNLTSVTIPESVTTIGRSAFYGCSNLTDVYITDIAAWLRIASSSNLLSENYLEKKLYLNGELITDLVIPEGCTSIGDYAFYRCSSLTSVTIPDSVTSIGHSAFSGCSNLTSVTISENVTSIGNNAFSSCSSLTSVTIPESVTSIGWSVFYGCSSLTSVTIPDSVTTIGDYAFSGCSGLTNVTIPDSVTIISDYAFSGCSGLTSVTIPDSVTTIGDYAFSGCSNLQSLYVEENNQNYSCDESGVLYSKDKTEIIRCPQKMKGSYSIPEGVATIADSAFSGCSSLISVTIPENVTSIGNNAFSDCSNLTNVTLPESVTSIGGGAFENCISLTDVIIPDGVTGIGGYTFSGCSGLTSVTIPDSVTSIGDTAFPHDTRPSIQDVYYGGTSEQWGELIAYDWNPKITAQRYHFLCSSADGHWNTAATPPTCAVAGFTVEECTCGHNRNKTPIPATGDHRYTSAATAPTCTADGYTTYTCTCGKSYTGDPVAKLGHHLGVWVITKEATKTEMGIRRSECTRCDYFVTQEIPYIVPQNPFSDVANTAYYHAPVLWAVENGITNGRTATTFAPDEFCKRSEVVTFLHRSQGTPASSGTDTGFTDVLPGKFYTDAVAWAVGAGVTNGMGDGTFGTELSCTRGQVVTFLWRAAGKPTPTSTEHPFTDLNPDAFYYDAVLWAVEEGITNGMTATTFGPEGTCTRGQIVTFLHRFAG